MFNKSGFNAKQSTDLGKFRGLCTSILMRAFADEGEGGAEGNDGKGAEGTPEVNFETLIANARKEEKEKLYPRIKKLEEENKVLTQSNNSNLIKLAEAQEKIKEYEAKGDSEVVADLRAQLATAQAEIATLKESTPNEEDIRARIEAEYEVKMYRQTKLSEGSNEILTVFAEEVTGNTKEEIDASFQKAVEKTIQTKKQLGLVDEDGNPIEKAKPSKKKKAETNTPPVANPSAKDDEGYDLDYVQSLDPRSEEYKEFRKKMGLK